MSEFRYMTIYFIFFLHTSLLTIDSVLGVIKIFALSKFIVQSANWLVFVFVQGVNWYKSICIGDDAFRRSGYIVSSGRLTHSHKNTMIVHCSFIWITENNLTILSIDQSESCRDLKSLVEKKNEVVMCRNSDIAIPTLVNFCYLCTFSPLQCKCVSVPRTG